MTTVLLDTTVASILHPKRKGSSLRLLYDAHMRGQVLAVSFQTVAELWAWAEDSRWGDAQRTSLAAFLSRFLVLPYTSDLAQAWARVMTRAKRAGRRLEAGDGWIAASAVLYAVPLLTHDADFTGLGVEGLQVVCHA